MAEITDRVLDEIAYERTAQDIKWGQQNHPDGTSRALAHFAFKRRLACQRAAENSQVTWRHILDEEIAEASAAEDPAELARRVDPDRSRRRGMGGGNRPAAAMTLHPWQLHAATALCSLAASWPALRRAAAAVTVEASDGLRSTVYGRTSSGSPGDGGMLAAIEGSLDEHLRWQQLLDRVADHVTDAAWLALANRPGLCGGPLAVIARALPACPPPYARDIAACLRDADRTARTALTLPPARQALVGVPCPTCDTRLLEAHTASPHRAAWTVTCAAGCWTDGAPSIWRWTVIAARTSTTSTLPAAA